MSQPNDHAAADGPRGSCAPTSERHSVRHGRQTGQRRPFWDGLVIALGGAILILSGLCIILAGLQAWEAQEFADVMAVHDAGRVTERMVQEAVAPPRFGTATEMTATWYGKAYCGRRTASGVIFDCQALTAAHRTLPFGTRLRVEHQGRAVVVTINDRGPLIEGRDLDLSEAAFREVAPLARGVIRVAVRREVAP
jgi:3D (Asp-Asp-Asp) domain-containing protein